MRTHNVHTDVLCVIKNRSLLGTDPLEKLGRHLVLSSLFRPSSSVPSLYFIIYMVYKSMLCTTAVYTKMCSVYISNTRLLAPTPLRNLAKILSSALPRPSSSAAALACLVSRAAFACHQSKIDQWSSMCHNSHESLNASSECAGGKRRTANPIYHIYNLYLMFLIY
jgi:hypothetical protein